MPSSAFSPRSQGSWRLMPAVLILKLGGASWVLYVDILVFAAAAGRRQPAPDCPLLRA